MQDKMEDFKLEDGVAVPAPVRIGGTSAKYPLADMKPGQSFLVAVKVPPSIKEEKEKENYFREEARTAANRVTGAIGRFRKKNKDSHNFTVRTIAGEGVRVFCLKKVAKSQGSK